jgi:hypothetical protein
MTAFFYFIIFTENLIPFHEKVLPDFHPVFQHIV